jgi:hypothetical protein
MVFIYFTPGRLLKEKFTDASRLLKCFARKIPRDSTLTEPSSRGILITYFARALHRP